MNQEKVYTLTKKELNLEKNKVIAKFASIASHDLKNVVAGLSNISYFLNKSLKVENDNQKKMLNLLSVEVVNLNDRITEILDMTRVKQIKKAPCNLNEVISKAVEDSKKEGINFELNLIPVKVYGDKEKLWQVFFSIIKNAKDSMDNKGTVKINMSEENDTVSVSVSDSGKGMDADTLDQCFDPMFSTKLSRAVGMGLTIALQIAEMHNGTIKISTKPDFGTTVTVLLPVLKE